MAIGKSERKPCQWCGNVRVLKLVKIPGKPKSKGLSPFINVCAKCEDKIKTWLKDET